MNSLPIGACTTSLSVSRFSEYENAVFIPFVTGTVSKTSRTDIEWDDYRPESLKKAILVKRQGPE